ncbi:MAG: hypothetical protein KKA60_01055 [Proteobacteria bacterium]|nr:hypothetical protein [Pseudomonadota bacterium]
MEFYFWLLAFTLAVLVFPSAIPVPFFPGGLGGLIAGLYAPRWYCNIREVSFDSNSLKIYIFYTMVFLLLSIAVIRKKRPEKIVTWDSNPYELRMVGNMEAGFVVVFIVSFFFLLVALLF